MMALEGIHIVDLIRLAPGPYCTQILGDLGAQVIKIEEPGAPTGRRAAQAGEAPEMVRVLERNSPYYALNRNKRNIALNLKSDDARQVFYKLTEKSDVVVEEFRPGVADRLGIGYDILKEINPRIIYCAITGYGQDGPYRNLVGHNVNYIATAGALGLIGEKDRKPQMPLNLLADFAGGGMHGAIGILAALIARERTGRGQFVDIAMTDGVVSLLSEAMSQYFYTGKIPERGTTILGGAYPQMNVYECKDGRYISIASAEPWFFANLCRATGRPDFIPFPWDEAKREEIFDHLNRTFKTKPRDEWVETLRQTDTCVAPVYSLDELEKDPQLRHRKMVVEVAHPELKTVKQPGISIKLSDTPGKIRSLAVSKGTHTDEVLKELGYGGQDISCACVA